MFAISVVVSVLVWGVLASNATTKAAPSNHGDPNLLCRPAKWTDIVVFYLGNYVAHAATAKSIPGQSQFQSIMTVVSALLFPTSGVYRGVRAILNRAIFADTELRTAARAGALCVVVRDIRVSRALDIPLGFWDSEEQLPHPIQHQPLVPADWLDSHLPLRPKGPETVGMLASRVHGRISLPEGWTLKTVPRSATFVNDPPDDGPFWRKLLKPFIVEDRPKPKLSYNYSLVKAAVAIGQTLFAAATLYRTQGDQIVRFGYAAFGLTVAPYAFMSLVNLIGNLVCPDYPAMFVVENSELRQLRRLISTHGREADFYVDGVVGQLTPEGESQVWRQMRSRIDRGYRADDLLVSTVLTDYLLLALAAAVPLGIVGGISRFRPGHSTHAERTWTMTWMVFSFVTGFIASRDIHFENWREIDNKTGGFGLQLGTMNRSDGIWTRIQFIVIIVAYAAPALGGYVVVGQEIASYGVCVAIA